MEPGQVGNERRVLVSDLSGKSNVEYKAKELGIKLGDNGHDSKKIVSEIKQLEQDGYQFDAAEGSFKILIEKFTDQFKPLFELETFRVTIEKDKDQPCTAHATVKISVGNNQEITAAEGYGPVSALDNALRKALDRFYPDLDTMRLVDFKKISLKPAGRPWPTVFNTSWPRKKILGRRLRSRVAGYGFRVTGYALRG
jgi:2-isopropylmalate synthase